MASSTTPKFEHLLFGLVVFAAGSANATICAPVSYEPRETTLSGSIVISVVRHPNGTPMKNPILRLEAPVTVMPSEQANPINVVEPCVWEVQLFSPNRDLHEQLLNTTSATVTGTLFHEHTAWHVRKVVMKVETLQATTNRRKQ